MTIQDIRTEFEKYIILKDPWVLDLILATIIGNTVIPRDPIWTMIVAPSSGGKTTLLAPMSSMNKIFFIDDLSEKSLMSGFKVKGKETSLLKMIGSGIMAFSDFTSILSKNPMSRGEILTQLKMVYDGKFTKYTGMGGQTWEGKVGFIGASTPDIYHHLESGRSMGERFLYYWLEQPTDKEIITKQQDVTLSAKEITEVMKGMYSDYCHEIAEYIDKNGLPPLSLTADQRLSIRQAALFCVLGKSTVHTNFKTGKADQIPNKAGVGRDNKVFDALLHTLQVMDAHDSGDKKKTVSQERIEMVEKCAYSSINRERRKILEILCAEDRPLSSSEIGAKPGLGLEKDSVEMYLIPMHAVGLIRKKIGSPHRWFIDDDDTRVFVNRVSKRLQDITPTAKVEDVEPVAETEVVDTGLNDLWEQQAREQGLHE